MNKKLLQVSVDTLSGINWMGASRLVSVMEQTANRGPFDKFTWKKFIARAELIASTNGFRPIQVSRILRYMYMANYRDERFLCKLHSLIDDKFVSNSDIGTFCGIVQGFKRLSYPENWYKQILDSYKNFLLTLDIDDYFQYSLLLNAYTYPEYSDVICQLMKKHFKNNAELSAKELSMITNCITKISRNNTDLERFIPILFEYILNKLDNIDLQSATILLNSLSRFPKFSKTHYIDVLTNNIIASNDRINLQQIIMALRSLRRLKYMPLGLIDAIMPRLELMISQAEPLQLSSIIGSVKSLNINNQKLMDLITSTILNNIDNYNLSHSSHIAYRMFNDIDQTKINDYGVLAKLISKRVEQNITKLSVHDIVLFCLSLVKYWVLTPEFNDLELKLLNQANKLIKNDQNVLDSDKEVIYKLYSKYIN